MLGVCGGEFGDGGELVGVVEGLGFRLKVDGVESVSHCRLLMNPEIELI